MVTNIDERGRVGGKQRRRPVDRVTPATPTRGRLDRRPTPRYANSSSVSAGDAEAVNTSISDALDPAQLPGEPNDDAFSSKVPFSEAVSGKCDPGQRCWQRRHPPCTLREWWFVIDTGADASVFAPMQENHRPIKAVFFWSCGKQVLNPHLWHPMLSHLGFRHGNGSLSYHQPRIPKGIQILPWPARKTPGRRGH